MMSDLIILDTRRMLTRSVLVGLVMLIGVCTWFGVRWQLGNMLADLTQPGDPNTDEIAAAAQELAPADPLVYRLLASAVGDPDDAITYSEQAVRLAPADFRRRLELARAYAQNDDLDRAEAQYRAAVELAPEHAAPRWFLGNHLLRQEREDEAFAELRKAAAHNQTYREQVFSLAWDYYQKDAARLEDLVSEPAAIAHLAFFFAARGAAEPALRNWSRLSDGEKERFRYRAVLIADGLYIQRHFAEALAFSHTLGQALAAKPNTITNPSFEAPIGEAAESRFDWEIARNEPRLEIGADGRTARTGSRSLRFVFRGYSKPVLLNARQTVVVEPRQRYTLSLWYRTEDLRSAGMPILEVLNGTDDAVLARTQPFPAGTGDWKQVTLDFSTPETCSGIILRTVRNYCGDDCPITGTLWYDDFEMARS